MRLVTCNKCKKQYGVKERDVKKIYIVDHYSEFSTCIHCGEDNSLNGGMKLTTESL